jgi:hypothetical protein
MWARKAGNLHALHGKPERRHAVRRRLGVTGEGEWACAPVRLCSRARRGQAEAGYGAGSGGAGHTSGRSLRPPQARDVSASLHRRPQQAPCCLRAVLGERITPKVAGHDSNSHGCGHHPKGTRAASSTGCKLGLPCPSEPRRGASRKRRGQVRHQYLQHQPGAEGSGGGAGESRAPARTPSQKVFHQDSLAFSAPICVRSTASSASVRDSCPALRAAAWNLPAAPLTNMLMPKQTGARWQRPADCQPGACADLDHGCIDARRRQEADDGRALAGLIDDLRLRRVPARAQGGHSARARRCAPARATRRCLPAAIPCIGPQQT